MSSVWDNLIPMLYGVVGGNSFYKKIRKVYV